MSRINLLPWRDELRREKNVEFGAICLTVLVVALLIALGVNRGIHYTKLNQQKRNDLLSDEIKKLDNKLVKIKEFDKKREELAERIRSISALQKGLHKSVSLFNEIASTIPQETYLKLLQQKGQDGKLFLLLDGVSLKNRFVSKYMENLDKSKFFGKPLLKYIKLSNVKVSSGRRSGTVVSVNNFSVRVDIASEEKKPKDGNKAKPKRGN